MRAAPVALCLALALLASGCGDLLALHALATPQTRVWDASIEGQWVNGDEQLMVTRLGDHYQILLRPKRQEAEEIRWEATLTDLNGVRFADLLAPDTVGHMFAKVQANSHELRLSFFDSDWLRRRVPHEEADLQDGRKQAVMTAATPKLRGILSKFAREPHAFDPQEHVWQK